MKQSPRRQLNPAWVKRRQQGETATHIARDVGCSPSWVSASTAAAGPFPRHRPIPAKAVKAWVVDRRAGWSVNSIARRDAHPAKEILRATAPHGPFPRGHHQRLEDEPIGIVGISRLVGVADPVVWHWHQEGHLPPPDSATPAGRPRWSPDTITTWLKDSGHPTCHCGARPRSLIRHQAAAHPTLR